MTKEEKQLLLRDLSARLPYGTIMNTPNGDGHLCSINQTIFGNEYGINISATKYIIIIVKRNTYEQIFIAPIERSSIRTVRY